VQPVGASRRILVAHATQAVSSFLVLSSLVLYPACGEAVRMARAGFPLLRFSVRGRGGSGFRLPGEGQRRTGDSWKREVRSVHSSTHEVSCESPFIFTAKIAISPAPDRIARQNPPSVWPSIALLWKMVWRSNIG
jgi:hypothetical protein